MVTSAENGGGKSHRNFRNHLSGTRYYNLEDYSITELKMCKKRMPREVFGLEENKQHHRHNGNPRE